MDLYEEFQKIITILQRGGIEFAVCGGIVALKNLCRLSLKAELLMTLEAMTDAVPKDLRPRDPGRDVHESEEYAMADGTMAFDGQSGAPLKPELMRRAGKDEIPYFKDIQGCEKVPIEEW